MEAVSKLTLHNFKDVLLMDVNEFFAYVAYCRYKAAKEEQQLREFRLKNKI